MGAHDFPLQAFDVAITQPIDLMGMTGFLNNIIRRAPNPKRNPTKNPTSPVLAKKAQCFYMAPV